MDHDPAHTALPVESQAQARSPLTGAHEHGWVQDDRQSSYDPPAVPAHRPPQHRAQANTDFAPFGPYQDQGDHLRYGGRQRLPPQRQQHMFAYPQAPFLDDPYLPELHRAIPQYADQEGYSAQQPRLNNRGDFLRDHRDMRHDAGYKSIPSGDFHYADVLMGVEEQGSQLPLMPLGDLPGDVVGPSGSSGPGAGWSGAGLPGASSLGAGSSGAGTSGGAGPSAA